MSKPKHIEESLGLPDLCSDTQGILPEEREVVVTVLCGKFSEQRTFDKATPAVFIPSMFHESDTRPTAARLPPPLARLEGYIQQASKSVTPKASPRLPQRNLN